MSGSTVDNRLDEDTSIHWHGLIVPFQMDGVPGVSFPGITAALDLHLRIPGQAVGHLLVSQPFRACRSRSAITGRSSSIPPGPIRSPTTASMSSCCRDWSFLHPHQIFARLKQEGGFFNRQQADARRRLTGDRALTRGRARRCSPGCGWTRPTSPTSPPPPTPSSINGHGPAENWTGLFRPGERVRLRIINAAAQTIFNVRIPGLPMTVVADRRHRRAAGRGRRVPDRQCRDLRRDRRAPRTAPTRSSPRAIDRSGMARATLGAAAGMRAAVPPLRERPDATHEGHGHGRHGAAWAGRWTIGGTARPRQLRAAPMDHANMDMRDKSKVDFPVGVGRRHDRPDARRPHRRSRHRPRRCRPQGADLSRPRLADAEPRPARRRPAGSTST